MEGYIYQMEPVFDETEAEAVAACIRSGWVTEAELTAAFEQTLATTIDAKYAVAVPSCTVAMALSLMALGVEHGDEVIVPAISFVATANAVSLAGATAVFVDIDPQSYGLDPDQTRQAITSKTKAILPVWLNGHNPDIRTIVNVANEFGLPVVEDAACALGSRVGGRHAGTFGRLGCFSFNTTKIITTGTGGLVVTDDAKLFEKVKRLKNHGRTDRRDFHPSVGYNFYFSDLLAALGLAQLEKLPARVQWKQQLCRWYFERLHDVEGIKIRLPAAGICPWYPEIFVEKRPLLMTHLQEQNIQTRSYYPPITTQPSYFHERPFPHAARLGHTGLWLPSAAYLNEETVDHVCQKIKNWAHSLA